MNNKLLLCLSLVLANGLASKALAQGPAGVQAYNNRKVGSIRIKVENLPEGSIFDRQTIASKLQTREGDPFSQYVFDQDLKQLAQDYDRIEPEVQIKDGEVDITLKVWIRPFIREIKWEGNTFLKTKALQKELDIKPGTLLKRADFNNAFNKVKEYYIKKGYFESQLSYRIVSVPKTQEVDIVIDVNEGRSGKVDKINFTGFSKKEESQLLNQLYTKKYSALTSWFTGMGKFNEEALEQDRLTIFNYLQNQGYADARVKIQILESRKNGKIIIDISADKGPIYHFGNVSFDGNILFPDEQVEKIFKARPDTAYSPEKLRETAEAIKELYGRKGYIDASVTYETQLDLNAPIYNVHFHVDEGRGYRIGMIRIIGNAQTEGRVILRESLLVPGETFDSLKLKVTQARLENMGYFKSVNVYAVRTQDDLSLGENYRDIYIEVEETQTGNIGFSGGFSSTKNIFGGLGLTEKNFNARGLGRVFNDGLSSLRGGGEYLQIQANFGSRQQNYTLSWLDPYFIDSLWRLGFEFNAIVNSDIISKDYDINTYSLGLFVSYPLSPYLAYGFRYRVKNVDIDLDIDNKLVNKQQNSNSGILSGFGGSLTYDSTDHPIKPHRGLRSMLDAEIVGAGGDANFFRTGYLNSFYTPLWSRGYMRYRWDFRFIVPFGKTDSFRQIPISERYFLGGVASVRGYQDFILGPRFRIIDKDDETKRSKGDPTGGISSSLLSIEYNQAIFPFMEAFTFVDAGYVSAKVFGFGTYRMSYGVGVNINVLGQMPLTVGYGIPINPRSHQENRFFYSFGAQF